MQGSMMATKRQPLLAACQQVASGSGKRQLQTAATEQSIRTPAPGPYEERSINRRDRAKALIRDRDRVIPPVSSPFLMDRHHRRHSYLRISLTERCNLRCMYCMPEEGVSLTPKESLMTASEVERVARLFVKEGVNKIRLTGGEPTVRKDLPDVIAGLSSLRQYGLKQIGITTNGLTLSRHLPNLVSSGLTHLNVSLDTLDPFKFEIMTRRPASGLEKVLKGIDAALAMGVPQVKINVVAIRGLNDGKDVLDFVEWAKHRNVTVRFIEYMPFDGNRWKPEKLVPFHELIETISAEYGPMERLQDDANDTSKHWRVPGHLGRIGFISSMTDHFCGTCNRLRITADGNLKVCLFGNAEVSLRDAMRIGLPHYGSIPASDGQLLEIIGAAVDRKHAKHAGMSNVTELAKGAATFKAPRRVSHKATPFSLVGLEEIATATSPRHYTSARGYSTGPWDRLDQDVDERSSKILQSSGNTHQSWSKYMGTEEDGDDSPWASLDAIADGAKDLAKAVPEQQPGIPTKQADYSTDWETAAIAAAEAFASTQSDKAVRSAAEMSEPRLTHINPRDDRASMVDVSSKDVTTRTAQAEARVYFPDVVLQLLNGEEIEKSNARRKGSVLQTAQLAGIMGAKRTSELIPLCHGLNLSHVDVELQVHSSGEVQELPHFILIRCTAKTTSQTGVEMEALTGASIAALTVWDMLKSVGGQQMRIDGLMVTSKSGGKSGSWTRRPKSTIV